MIRPSTILFLFEEAGKSIRRNGLMSIAALAVVTLSLAVFGGALFVVHRLYQVADSQPRQFEIEVFLKPDATRDEALDLQQRVQKAPGVAKVTLFPKEKALAELQESDSRTGAEIAGALENENPLPDRLDIRLEDPAMTRAFSKLIRDPSLYPHVDVVRDAQDDLDKLLAAAKLVRNVGGGLAALLLISTGFMIQNTIRLTVLARRKEIKVMQLVGATPGFIRFPMVLEGLFYGIAGAAVATLIIYLAVRQVSLYGARIISPLTQGLPEAVSPLTGLVVLIGAGAGLGWLGSWLSIRRFLKRA